jgi:hypothetical protein
MLIPKFEWSSAVGFVKIAASIAQRPRSNEMMLMFFVACLGYFANTSVIFLYCLRANMSNQKVCVKIALLALPCCSPRPPDALRTPPAKAIFLVRRCWRGSHGFVYVGSARFPVQHRSQAGSQGMTGVAACAPYLLCKPDTTAAGVESHTIRHGCLTLRLQCCCMP